MKDPNAPRRPTTAYLLFCQQNRDKLRAANPGMSFLDITKELGQQWTQLDEEERQVSWVYNFINTFRQNSKQGCFIIFSMLKYVLYRDLLLKLKRTGRDMLKSFRSIRNLMPIENLWRASIQVCMWSLAPPTIVVTWSVVGYVGINKAQSYRAAAMNADAQVCCNRSPYKI